jgi:hypothetical protein
VKRVFVCSPYRGDVVANTRRAVAACRTIALAGDAPFAPHLYLPLILDDSRPVERAVGIACGLAWLAVADEIRVFGEPSEGMHREIEAARRIGVTLRRMP